MRKFSFSALQKILVFFMYTSFSVFAANTEELVPIKLAPFHNLIPRFKMPPGNLLRYKIPQWEVLYFLKYGIVPFIFYDPHFNRTNFITKVHKFKMYFDDGRPNKTTELALKDDDSFREFLRKHGYPNYNQLPENALSRNNKIVEEINRLLRATNNAQAAPASSDGGEKGGTDGHLDSTFPLLLDAIIEDLDRGNKRVASDELNVRKRGDISEELFRKGGHNFWGNLITRYSLTWKYTKSVVGTRNLLLNHASSWIPERLSYTALAPGRTTKSTRIGIRNVNMDAGDGEAEDMQRGSGSADGRKGAKTFQTQGWWSNFRLLFQGKV